MSIQTHIRFNPIRLALTLLLVALGALSTPTLTAASSVPDSGAAELLQVTSGGHVLGFQPGAMIVSNGMYALRVEFLGAADVAPKTLQGGAGVPAGSDQAAPPLTQVTYRDLWPGVSLRYDAGGGILRSTYTLAPGADPDVLHLQYNAPVTIDANGELVARYETGEMRESAPVAWQEVDGARIPVAVAFQVSRVSETAKVSTIGFRVGAYDSALPLFIDPTLTWNAFLGGNGDDYGRAIAVDGSSNVYVAGFSTATWGSPVRTYGGGTSDAFVAALDSSGGLTWNTFLGGDGDDYGTSIAVDGIGNVYVAGITVTTWGSPVRAYGGGASDAFVAVLDSNGGLTWNTFLGGDGNDYGTGIAMDGSSNVYVAGFSTATWGSPVRAYTAGEDAFAARLDSSGELTWNTFLGGSEFDYGSAVVVDGSGNVYVAGFSAATWGAPVRAHYSGVNDDAFAARLDGSGELIWNTFLGGSGTDDGLDIAVDGSGNVYVTGVSNAAWGSPVRAYTAEEDAFAARLDSDGELTWNTFLGGSGGYYDYGDYGYDIAVDGSGNVYVAGSSAAAWGSPARAYTAGRDTFAARLNSGGGLTWNTFLGGSGGDYGFAGAVDGSGNVYVTGDSNAAWGSPMRGYTAGEDACVVKLPPFNTFADDDGVCGGNSPCYISFQTALDNVMTTGAVTYYPGTFNESVSLTENVTASHAGGGSVTIDGALAISAGTLDAPGADTLSLTGDLTRSGGTFSHNSGTFTFAGSGIQSITGDFAFNNLTVNSGATMDAGSNTVTVNGTLTNNGVVRQSRAVGGPGLLTFNLTGVQVNVTTQGSLSGLQTDWVESDHPNSPSGYTAARYWSVTPTGSGYTVGLILPHDSLSNPYVCRHVSGTTWDCGRASFTSSTVTRTSLNTLSDWTVYDGNPTAVTLASFTAAWNGDVVQVAWETALEIDTVGFNVWRSTAPDGAYVRINGSLIPSMSPGSVFGASYSYVDKSVIHGETYYYKLEELEVGGGRNWYGPTATAGDGPTAAMLASLNVAFDGTALWTWGALALGIVVAVAGVTLIRWRRV